jgi:hypothetical protein
LVCTVIIGGIIYWGIQYQNKLRIEGTMDFHLLPSILFLATFPVVIGILLRLPKLIIEIIEKNPWTFDWIKFVVVGLPSLYIVVMSILPYTPLGREGMLIPEIILVGSPTITTIAGIIFGYVILDVLKK